MEHTVRPDRLPLRKMLHKQPTRGLLDEVALEGRHALVLGRVREGISGVIRGAQCGVRGVQFQDLRDGLAGRVRVVRRVNVVEELGVGAAWTTRVSTNIGNAALVESRRQRLTSRSGWRKRMQCLRRSRCHTDASNDREGQYTSEGSREPNTCLNKPFK